MKQLMIGIVAIFLPCLIFAQSDSLSKDSAQILDEVTIRAYESNTGLMKIPAPVTLVTKSELSRFGSLSILPALNMNPGIRMEERSPSSYRLNIRGSSLRAPFGVRNIKIYYNDIPYTDPAGNSYLNQLGFYNFQGIEVIKGPGSSLYGAGTGGVVLINSVDNQWSPGVSTEVARGNYGTWNNNNNLRFGTTDFQNTLNFVFQESEGYREQTASRRKVFTWDTEAKLSDKASLKAHVLFGDLFYETPGGLTAAEYAANPRSARPRVGNTPGAEEAHAAIFSKMYLAGLSTDYKFSSSWKNTTSLYGAFTEIKNPTIRNYEKRTEPNAGARTVFAYTGMAGNTTIRTNFGAEVQGGQSNVRVAGNKNGNPDTLQTEDEINNLQYFVFGQVSAEFQGGWIVTGGASFNKLRLGIFRLSSTPVTEQEREYRNEIAPRLAVLKQLGEISLFASVSKGFSPPTTAEVLPSTGVITTNLEAEHGISYETGIRGNLLQQKLYFEVNAYLFQLSNTIAQRRDAQGADYFVNAGSTRQLGIESQLSYLYAPVTPTILRSARFSVAHTWNDFTYRDYTKIANDTSDLSGNKLPSVAPNVFTAGLDLRFAAGLYANLSYYYSDPIPLNDINTAYASSFQLLSARVGFRREWNKWITDIYVSGDNLFDLTYSLGNDINAFGGRYYNAATDRNIIGGIMLGYRL